MAIEFFSLCESQIGTFPTKTLPMVATYNMGKVTTHDNDTSVNKYRPTFSSPQLIQIIFQQLKGNPLLSLYLALLSVGRGRFLTDEF